MCKGYGTLNRCVFNLDLNTGINSEDLIWSDSSFQNLQRNARHRIANYFHWVSLFLIHALRRFDFSFKIRRRSSIS